MPTIKVLLFALIVTILGCSSEEGAGVVETPKAPVDVSSNATSFPKMLSISEVRDTFTKLPYFAESTYVLEVDGLVEITCESGALMAHFDTLAGSLGGVPDTHVDQMLTNLVEPYLDMVRSANPNIKGCSYSLIKKTGNKLKISVNDDFFFNCSEDKVKALAILRGKADFENNKLAKSYGTDIEVRPIESHIRDAEFRLKEEIQGSLRYISGRFGTAYAENIPGYWKFAGCEPGNKSIRANRSKSLIKKS